jgi:hypothetical protein
VVSENRVRGTALCSAKTVLERYRNLPWFSILPFSMQFDMDQLGVLLFPNER